MFTACTRPTSNRASLHAFMCGLTVEAHYYDRNASDCDNNRKIPLIDSERRSADRGPLKQTAAV